MMQVMKDIGGVEMPEYLARLSPEPPPAAPETKNGAHAAAEEPKAEAAAPAKA
jgi:hypothetical protein